MVRNSGAWMRPARRLLSPVGLALVLACLWLPFLVSPPPSNLFATVAPSVTYTGVDLAFGGTAEVLLPMWSPDGRSYEAIPVTDQQMYGHPQPRLGASLYGPLAVGLIVSAILASLIPIGRLRAFVAGSAALLGALALLALETSQRLALARMLSQLLGPLVGLAPGTTAPLWSISPRVGFVAAMGLLVVIGFAHIAVSVPAGRPVASSDEPALP